MSAVQRGRPPLDSTRAWALHQQGVGTADIAVRMGYHRRTVAEAIKAERERLAGLAVPHQDSKTMA